MFKIYCQMDYELVLFYISNRIAPKIKLGALKHFFSKKLHFFYSFKYKFNSLNYGKSFKHNKSKLCKFTFNKQKFNQCNIYSYKYTLL